MLKERKLKGRFIPRGSTCSSRRESDCFDMSYHTLSDRSSRSSKSVSPSPLISPIIQNRFYFERKESRSIQTDEEMVQNAEQTNEPDAYPGFTDLEEAIEVCETEFEVGMLQNAVHNRDYSWKGHTE
jgi:hypothetical protein